MDDDWRSHVFSLNQTIDNNVRRNQGTRRIENNTANQGRNFVGSSPTANKNVRRSQTPGSTSAINNRGRNSAGSSQTANKNVRRSQTPGRTSATNNQGRNSTGFNQTTFNHVPRNRSLSHNQRMNGQTSYNINPGFERQYNNGRQVGNQGEGNNGGQWRRNGGKKFLGFKFLESLCEQGPDEVVMTLNKECAGLKELLNTDLTNDFIVIVVKILKIICECTHNSVRISLIHTILRSRFHKQLLHYISELAMQSEKEKKFNSYFWKNTDEFWYDLIKIFKTVTGLSKSLACEYFPKLVKNLLMCLPNIESEMSLCISDEIKREFHIINDTLAKAVIDEDETEGKASKPKFQISDYDDEPPNDFREINVYPNREEITIRDRSFVRQNVIYGPYKSVDHYLDVQYRLLREDFVGPLRDGICAHLYQDNKRSQNIRIYKDVQFLCLEIKTEYNSYRIKFDNSKKKNNFKYENSRRFMFGSLLCFTNNNFETIIFGKLVDRDIKLLENGELLVGFKDKVNINFGQNYLMVECNVFFEPYYHVLTVLKSIDLETFPMQKYIIEVNNTTNYPEYLQQGVYYKINNRLVSPFNWKDVHYYGHNESQSKAFKAALTQEMCIIQGPPGTGKTYLGLNITRTLINSSHMWYKNSPILVICYTNHALDQFLEGILHVTDKIIRVGSQSKNENVQKFNLRSHKQRRSPAVAQKAHEVRKLLSDLKNNTEYVENIDKFDSIVHFNIFADIPFYRNSWFSSASKEDILKWLLFDDSDEDQVEQANRFTEVNNGFGNLKLNDSDSEYEDAINDQEDLTDENEDVDDYLTDGLMVTKYYPSISLDSLSSDIRVLHLKINQLEEGENILLRHQLIDQINNLHKNFTYLKNKLDQGRREFQIRQFDPPKYFDMRNPQYMTSQERWDLYFYFLQEYKKLLNQKYLRDSILYKEVYKEYEELRSIEDAQVMKGALVVGMTTTGAARLRTTLESLRNPIVIVEEAAEVLEAHIVTSITENCKHLILIGDHQQLKPSTSNYEIETKYNLGISLFERMVNNGIQLHTLNVQHRMRPEISSLITPNIYPNLVDHDSVKQRPIIDGIDPPLYFIDHEIEENICQDESKKNIHEAKFLIFLCRHLILNGYKPENITILAAYLGQMYEMQREKKQHSHLLKNVRIAVLDNYQGEESDIILLSLVRSNNKNSIGFLKIENRVCVALSRARNGMYVMGNMNLLENNSKIWPKIKKSLKDQNAIGPTLRLKCQIHTSNVTDVSSYKDFMKIPEGGCTEQCKELLVCGHTCTSICHIRDRNHLEYCCRELCGKKLCDTNNGHICKKPCYEECGPCNYKVVRKLICGHIISLECHIDPDTYDCKQLVETKLLCGHIADKPCYRDLEKFRCPHPCDTQVEPCGHSCLLRCHIKEDPDHLQYKCIKPCAKFAKGCTNENEESHRCKKKCHEDCGNCEVLVKKERNCSHVDTVFCCINVNDSDCHKPCKKLLLCGHKCKNKCFEPCGPCNIIVSKTVPDCKHVIKKIKCSEAATRDLCKENCPRKMSCGHTCKKKCNEPCTSSVNCVELVDCSLPSSCGHIVKKIPCGLYRHFDPSESNKKIIQYCSEPCNTQLLCEHKCSGTCGKCTQGRMHVKCTSKCGAIQICNHECKIPCRQACKPCPEECVFKCKHSKCKKRCGEPCIPCKEKCPRKCPHSECTNLCGSLCSVPPCEEPCKKKLQCGHDCIGFCGDKCPELCKVCDKEEVEEIFFGTEDEEDARFVLLWDCQHIVESSGMTTFMAREENEVVMRVCPKCKVPIISTPRYTDYVKTIIKDISEVKAKVYGSYTENTRSRLKLLLEVQSFSPRSTPMLISDKFKEVIQVLAKRLEVTKNDRRQRINKKEIEDISLKVDILKNIIKIFEEYNSEKLNLLGSKECKDLIDFIVSPLLIAEDHTTTQEVSDMDDELNRLLRLVQFLVIKKSQNYKHASSNKDVISLTNEINSLINTSQRYAKSVDEKIKSSLDKLGKIVACSTVITDRERKEIVKAMGAQLGHWFKCPNGHTYYIGECGGAMQEAICICGEKIGGRNHALTAGNQHDRAMDDSSYPAWSEAANMANYRL